MTRFWRGCLIIAAAEAALIGAVLLFPGAGHSPLLYTQLPALMIVAWIDQAAGPCIPCEPSSWTVGIVAQVLLLIALWRLVDALFHSRSQSGA